MKTFLLTASLTLSLFALKAQWSQASGMAGTKVYGLSIKGSDIWAATNYGPYRSTDNGASFSSLHSGMSSSAWVFEILADGNDLYAALQSGGIYKSTNNGSSWTPVNSGLPSAAVLCLAAMNGSLFAGLSPGGVYMSTNGGSSWAAVNTGITNLNMRHMRVNGNTLYAGADIGLFKTTDGTNWTDAFAPISTISMMNGIVFNGGNIYIADDNNGKILLSTDNGATFTQPTNSLSCNQIFDLQIAGGFLFGGADQGVLVSSNNGVGFVYSNPPSLAQLNTKAVLVAGNYLFAGISNAGVWRRDLADFGVVSTGIKEQENSINVNVYPNPASGALSVSLENKKTDGHLKIRILSLTGREVLSRRLEQDTTSIDLSGISAGLYLYTLSDGSRVLSSSKLVIN